MAAGRDAVERRQGVTPNELVLVVIVGLSFGLAASVPLSLRIAALERRIRALEFKVKMNPSSWRQ